MELLEENPAGKLSWSRRLAGKGGGPLTLGLMLAVAGIFLTTFVSGYSKVNFLFLTSVDIANAGDLTIWRAFVERLHDYNLILPEVRLGQESRLFTPILFHRDFLHLFFNLLWLWWLGNEIELRRGSLSLLFLVLFFAGTTNVITYLIDGFSITGMSGVLYGLVAYAWMRGRFEPASRLTVHFFIFVMMSIWALVCLIGFWGPAITTANLSGFIIGMGWGFFSSPGSLVKKLRGQTSMRLNSR